MKRSYYSLLLLAALAACSTGADQNDADAADQAAIQRMDSISEVMDQSESELQQIKDELDDAEHTLDSLISN